MALSVSAQKQNILLTDVEEDASARTRVPKRSGCRNHGSAVSTATPRHVCIHGHDVLRHCFVPSTSVRRTRKTPGERRSQFGTGKARRASNRERQRHRRQRTRTHEAKRGAPERCLSGHVKERRIWNFIVSSDASREMRTGPRVTGCNSDTKIATRRRDTRSRSTKQE